MKENDYAAWYFAAALWYLPLAFKSIVEHFVQGVLQQPILIAAEDVIENAYTNNDSTNNNEIG